MIIVRFAGLAYRMHTPQWATKPLSGAGAALHGGRANRPGTEALYLSLQMQTAIAEYQQTSSLLPPGTLVSYEVDLARVVDFREYPNGQWDRLWDGFLCDWRHYVFDLHQTSPSWPAADQAIDAGHTGILFPSTITDGINLVVFSRNLGEADRLDVYDPDRRLPTNQRSWR